MMRVRLGEVDAAVLRDPKPLLRRLLRDAADSERAREERRQRGGRDDDAAAAAAAGGGSSGGGDDGRGSAVIGQGYRGPSEGPIGTAPPPPAEPKRWADGWIY